jgi:ERF superfamily
MTDTKAISAAMAKAFAAIEGASKDNENTHFKAKYADLSSVVAAIKPALIANELWFSQVTHEHPGGVCIETILHHSGGDSMSFGKLFVPAGKQDAQGYGSALTYARRYSLMTAFGVCPEDDDGNAAVAARPDKPQPISDEQRDELATLIDSLQLDVMEVCTAMKIKSLKHIPAHKFEGACKFINNFKKDEAQ